jgi:hypothetical protein
MTDTITKARELAANIMAAVRRARFPREYADEAHDEFEALTLVPILVEALTPAPMSEDEALERARFWILLHEPGCVPERKGPFREDMKGVIREFISARPTAYIDVLTIDSLGQPVVAHGPEMLQIFDGRSMSTGRKHNQRTRDAHAPYHAALHAPEPLSVKDALPNEPYIGDSLHDIAYEQERGEEDGLCGECNGTGVAEHICGYTRPCDACHGSGDVQPLPVKDEDAEWLRELAETADEEEAPRYLAIAARLEGKRQ